MKNTILFFALIIFCSCGTQKFSMGDTNGETISKDKQKSIRLFWGWIPIDKSHNFSYPNATGYKVTTRYNFGDFLVSALTGGIVILKTVKFEAIKSGISSQNNSVSQQNPTAKTGDIKKDFIADECGTLGLRKKYFEDKEFFSKYIHGKTKTEIIALIGEPNKEKENKLNYIIRANKCGGFKKEILNITLDENEKAISYGQTIIGSIK